MNKIKIDRILYYLTFLFVFFSLWTIAGTHITLGIAAFVWILKIVMERKWNIRRTPLDIPFLLFVLMCLLTTAFSIDPGKSFINMKNLMLIMVVYFIVTFVNDKKHVNNIVDLFVIVSSVIALVGLLTTEIWTGERTKGLQGITMTWGAMSAVFSVITLGLFMFAKSGMKRWLYLGAFSLQFLGMLFSYVRGSWVGFFAGVVVLALIKSKKLFFGFLVVMVLVFMFSPSSIKKRITSITDLKVATTQVRIEQWKNAVKIFKDYPVLGVGWVDLGEINRQYAPEGADLTYDVYTIGHFHNNYIMFLVCFGIVGFLVTMYMVFRIFQSVYHTFRFIPKNEYWFSALNAGIFAALVAFWVNGFFDWTFGDAEPVTLMWFIIGLSLAMQNIFDREKITNMV